MQNFKCLNIYFFKKKKHFILYIIKEKILKFLSFLNNHLNRKKVLHYLEFFYILLLTVRPHTRITKALFVYKKGQNKPSIYYVFPYIYILFAGFHLHLLFAHIHIYNKHMLKSTRTSLEATFSVSKHQFIIFRSIVSQKCQIRGVGQENKLF